MKEGFLGRLGNEILQALSENLQIKQTGWMGGMGEESEGFFLVGNEV